MRLGLALLALHLLACDSRFGAYLVIDGKDHQIAFDRIELYFGRETSATGIATPQLTDPKPATVFDRQFEEADLASTQDAVEETTYYVPASDVNAKLGDYVLVVAFAGDTPVGIGEYRTFEVNDREVTRYVIPLAPYKEAGLVDRWGDTPGCIAWQAHRPGDPDGVASVIAVVPRDDRDCDALAADLDCDDLSYCAPGETCAAQTAVCGDGATCAIGICSNDALTGARLCTPQVCVMPGVCDAECAPAGTDLEARLSCGVSRTYQHQQVLLPVQDGVACLQQVTLDGLGAPCANPAVELIDPKNNDGYVFQVSQAAGGGCLIEISPPTDTAPLGSDDHVVISFEVLGSPRWSVVVGFSPDPTNQDCATFHTQPGGEVDDCK